MTRKLAVTGRAFGENRSAIDASPALAVALLVWLVVELGLRVRAGRKVEGMGAAA